MLSFYHFPDNDSIANAKYVDRVTHAFGRIIIHISRVDKLCGECG